MSELERQLARYANDVVDRVEPVSADDVVREADGNGSVWWRPLATVAAAVAVVAIAAAVAVVLGPGQREVTIGPGQPTPSEPESSPSASSQAVAGGLPSPLVVSMPDIAVLDPTTGEILKTVQEAPVGEGYVALSVAPDGSEVYHHEVWTGCATRLWRTPLNGGQPQLLGPGFLPKVSPDGSTLAYVGYDPCVHDRHHLVLRNLDDGSEQTVLLDQPDDERAEIDGLAWSGDGETVAVEVGYSPRQQDVRHQAFHSDIHLVPVASRQPITSAPLLDEPDEGTEWRLGDYRGTRGGLLVIELCCDLPSDDPRPEEHAEVFRLVEVDATSGQRLTTLFERDTPIRSVDSDVTGQHILYFEGQQRRRQLRRFHDGQSHTITAANGDSGPIPYYADWGPHPPEAPRALEAPDCDELPGAPSEEHELEPILIDLGELLGDPDAQQRLLGDAIVTSFAPREGRVWVDVVAVDEHARRALASRFGDAVCVLPADGPGRDVVAGGGAPGAIALPTREVSNPHLALLTGVLRADPSLDGGCVWIATEQEQVSVIWPPGFAVRFTTQGAQLLDHQGRIVATAGQQVELGGSAFPSPPERCHLGDETWYAGSIQTSDQP